MASIFWMSASSSGATEAQPALLTSKVMLGSSFSFVSTFASPVSFVEVRQDGSDLPSARASEARSQCIF